MFGKEQEDMFIGLRSEHVEHTMPEIVCVWLGGCT